MGSPRSTSRPHIKRKEGKMARRKKEVSVNMVKTLRSKTGSSVHIPSVNLEELKMGIGLEAPYDHWGYLPPGWETNPHLIDFVKKGMVELGESDGMPAPAAQIPQDLDSAQREWIRTLCYGEYTEQFRTVIKDWRNPQLAAKTARRDTLLNRVLPLCEAAVVVERQVTNRSNVIQDLLETVNFIRSEGWRRANV